jgi:hypothetical protein
VSREAREARDPPERPVPLEALLETQEPQAKPDLLERPQAKPELLERQEPQEQGFKVSRVFREFKVSRDRPA